MRRAGFPNGLERGWDGWPGLFGWLILLLVVVGLGLLVADLWRRRGLRDAEPLRRAAARYAAGRIERVEFERIQQDLRAAEHPPAPVAVAAPPPPEAEESEGDSAS